jgi:biotin carboxyl carrier protein
MRITVEGKPYDVAVEVFPEADLQDGHAALAAVPPPSVARLEPVRAAHPAPVAAARHADPDGPAAGAVTAPLSGVVMSIEVAPGQPVKRNQVLLTLEAMKMKAPVHAPADGTVKSIAAKVNAAVEEGAVLVVLG